MLFLSTLYLLSSNAVSLRRDKAILYSRVAITILICCIVISFSNCYLEFHGKGLGLYGGTYYTTAITHIFHIFVFILTAIIMQLNGFYSRKISIDLFSSLLKPFIHKFVYQNKFILNKMSDQFTIIEYPLIILFIVIGGSFLMSSYDLISIFIAIELQSYGLYILCAIYRNSERATSGALTYFLLGGLSSCFILLASGLLYSNSGNTGFDGLFIINNISNAEIYEGLNLNYVNWYHCYYISFSLIIMSVGFLFKVSAAPFHFWSPDVYDAIPTVVTTFVAIFAKISIFILLLNLVYHTGDLTSLDSVKNIKGSFFNYSWTFTLLISSMLSLIIGSVLGLTQSRIKRLYAYSTISHIGFILLALTINSIESIQSFIFYLMQYSIANLNAFMLLIIIGYSLFYYTHKLENTTDKEKEDGVTSYNIKELSDKANSPLQLISQLKGYFYINPAISISLALTLFSFVGIPPLVGFFAKQMVLSSALDNGFMFMTLIAILTSVVSAYYYLVLIKQVFFFKSDYTLNFTTSSAGKGNILHRSQNRILKTIDIQIENVTISSYISICVSILSLIILIFILTPQEWLNLANILALITFS